MPLLSRRRRAVKSFSRTAYSRFASKTIELGYDEYVDIDDDRISNFKDVGMDDEIDVVDDVYREAIPVLPSLFVTKCKLWREVGHNTGIRGAGTSKSTIKRQKRKAKETADAAISCKKIIGYLLSETGNTSEAIASDAAYMSTTEPSTSLAETSVSDAAVTSNLELSQSIPETVVIVTLYIARTYVLTHRTYVLTHRTYVLTHRTLPATTSFSNQFSFLIVRQRQLEIHSIVAKLTLLSHSINYRYYTKKPTLTPLSQPNPLLRPICLTRSPVAPICPTGQSTFHLRPVRRSRDPA